MLTTLAEEMGVEVAQAREKLYWQMISVGWLPSQGWRVRDRFIMKGTKMHYECWAVCPAVKKKATTCKPCL